ncbi:MAG TPA: FMN-binding protein [Methylomirabilota bacterium]|nr:FMN-binding protein [Methylomirabilota bacterium]
MRKELDQISHLSRADLPGRASSFFVFLLQVSGQARSLCALALFIAGLLFTAPGIRAEKYLSFEELRKLTFPSADRTESIRVPVNVGGSGKARATHVEFIFLFEGERLLGTLALDSVVGKHELIDYAVSILPEGHVGQVEILEYRESHGSEVRGKRWRAQFKGKRADSTLRLNSDIYNISGATMSCRHVTEGVKHVLSLYEGKLVREHLAARKLRAQAAGK